ncbi:hypothetical protein [Nocardia brasiliensis]|uniref:hypothetical protein n=1 Tax=Nocardia brasiliensis TaxID=37326 RepID=UPI002454BD2F|nr:hypothetical protein [Nocardia brasiliensis]
MKFSRTTSMMTCALGAALLVLGPAARADAVIFGVAIEADEHMCDGSDHDGRWYQEIGEWLELSPLIFDKPVHTETRRALYGNPVFDKDTRNAMCAGEAAYNEKLQALITESYVVGNLHELCETNEGLLRYMKRRSAVFQWITVNDWNAPKPPTPTCLA